ncbi:MAG: hypothetical protein HC767_12705 [Akkermansiaceae bacterium]|nr:hypothetical protein [Akkermansiaceae bacterium]
MQAPLHAFISILAEGVKNSSRSPYHPKNQRATGKMSALPEENQAPLMEAQRGAKIREKKIGKWSLRSLD